MAKKNKAPTYRRSNFDSAPRTHEGALANVGETPLQRLERSVMACMLWEDTFYEGGVSIADRIKELCKQVSVNDICDLAVHTRTVGKLRHAPLLLLREAARKSGDYKTKPGERHPVRVAVANTLQRADEPAELISLYWEGGDRRKSKEKLSASLKKGIADAFPNFGAYGLAKYNRDGGVKLRDAMFIAHPKPSDEAQAAAFKKLASNELESADTWEVRLSAGQDKRETFESMLNERKLGFIALLRNLRNMEQAGVDRDLIREVMRTHTGVSKAMPFQFIAAEKHAPMFSADLDAALLRAMAGYEPLSGKTVVCVDVSGSMGSKISNKSEMTLTDAACGIAMCIPGDLRVIAFATDAKEVPARKGLALRDAIRKVTVGGGTDIARAVRLADSMNCDRMIVITDMQSNSDLRSVKTPLKYFVNVASYQHGIGEAEGFKIITGFSENTIEYIRALETISNN